eukprot:scaffold26496_cov113-Cylindrotheca_fusiformis.AAC.3
MEASNKDDLHPSSQDYGNEMLSRFSIFILSLLVAALVAQFLQDKKEGDASQSNDSALIVPFILIHGNEDEKPLRVLYRSLEKYRLEASTALKGLSLHLERAMSLETSSRIPRASRLSTKIRRRIHKLSECLDQNEQTLKSLLRPMSAVTALPDKKLQKGSRIDESLQATAKDSDDPVSDHTTIFQSTNTADLVDENVYDMTAQIVAHLVRDWTPSGAQIRKSLYEWVCKEIVQRSRTSSAPVLVAGAGMGRLAYDIHSLGFTVEANELSPVMAAAACAILTKKANGRLHPFALDPLSNEVDSNRRYDAVNFPDVEIRKVSGRASLSFTVGDFVGDYYYSQNGSFGAIVTCFFIDTATNIYEYIELTRVLLQPNGLWINVGPVQWHRNALLHPSVDELRDLISASGFRIVHWRVDSKPVPYRQDDSVTSMDPFIRSTNFDGYRPLRFVAVRR